MNLQQLYVVFRGQLSSDAWWNPGGLCLYWYTGHFCFNDYLTYLYSFLLLIFMLWICYVLYTFSTGILSLETFLELIGLLSCTHKKSIRSLRVVLLVFTFAFRIFDLLRCTFYIFSDKIFSEIKKTAFSLGSSLCLWNLNDLLVSFCFR